MMLFLFAAAVTATYLTAPGPKGPLEGTLLDAGKRAPVALIIPGSGPTDRDGNSPLGVKAQPYKLLAEALGAKGVSTVRIDKRGLFASKAAIPDANQVSVADYVVDTHHWVASIRRATGAKCVWLLGHSEGGLIALTAAQRPKDICGVIAFAAVGRRFGDVIRTQLRANPANAPILAPALATIDSLEQGTRVDSATLPPPLRGLFADSVQPFLIDLFAQNPARLAASLKVPLLIVQGDQDMQVLVEDAKVLAKAQPKAKLAILPGVNHVLKMPKGTDRAANLAAYADPLLPVSSAAVGVIATFVAKR